MHVRKEIVVTSPLLSKVGETPVLVRGKGNLTGGYIRELTLNGFVAVRGMSMVPVRQIHLFKER